jgi:hypothetical protein
MHAPRERRSPNRLALASALLLALALPGCGASSSDKKSVDAQHATQLTKTPGTDTTGTTPATAAATRPAPEHPAVTPAAPGAGAPKGGSASARVVLTSKGCVEFEPSWSTIHVGQSLSWRSELKTPVTIHVSSGVFDRVKFMLWPGALVPTGPARHAGSFAIWTEPAACQTAPHGVQGPGPGLVVEAAPPR